MDESPDEELPPSEQPPTDDPWVIVTPMPAKASAEPQSAPTPEQRPRRRRSLCPICGAYWACEHD